ncbi:MAG: class I SAM-dependent methyltransferase, partial [Sphaerochaetaceae bacterium]|nr:class I SAM-dependent methyltransferase [Sphaerochaetaceae bacterium]
MKKAESKVQVKKEHYSNKGYNDIFRFLSYQHQIESIISLNPKTILEIGIGNKLVSNQLKEMGYKVTTCDFDPKLKPDFVGDIRNLPFKKNEFDIVVAFEVLEHLPFEDFEKALSEMKRVSKKNCIISLPYPCFNFN